MVSLISEEVMYCYQNDIDILIDDYSYVIRKKKTTTIVLLLTITRRLLVKIAYICEQINF